MWDESSRAILTNLFMFIASIEQLAVLKVNEAVHAIIMWDESIRAIAESAPFYPLLFSKKVTLSIILSNMIELKVLEILSNS